MQPGWLVNLEGLCVVRSLGGLTPGQTSPKAVAYWSSPQQFLLLSFPHCSIGHQPGWKPQMQPENSDSSVAANSPAQSQLRLLGSEWFFGIANAKLCVSQRGGVQSPPWEGECQIYTICPFRTLFLFFQITFAFFHSCFRGFGPWPLSFKQMQFSSLLVRADLRK